MVWPCFHIGSCSWKSENTRRAADTGWIRTVNIAMLLQIQPWSSLPKVIVKKVPRVVVHFCTPSTAEAEGIGFVFWRSSWLMLPCTEGPWVFLDCRSIPVHISLWLSLRRLFDTYSFSSTRGTAGTPWPYQLYQGSILTVRDIYHSLDTAIFHLATLSLCLGMDHSKLVICL